MSTDQINICCRLIRSTAYVSRFVKNAQTKQRTMRNITPLSVEEIRHALNFLISRTQLRTYPEEVTALRSGRNINAKSTIRKLSPYIDDYKVLRVGGRLNHAPIPLRRTRFCRKDPQRNEKNVLDHQRKVSGKERSVQMFPM